MALPSFLRFTPVPVRARRDGWTPLLQRRFIIDLARGMGPAEAARGLGRSRQTAYALREKPGAREFAAAWDAAVDFACLARVAARPLAPAGGGIEKLFVPRFYRGRLVGFVEREDLGGTLRRLKTLDRLADRLGAFDPNSPAFDSLLGAIARGDGETVEADANRPSGLRQRQLSGAPDGLRQSPPDRLGSRT